MVVALALLDGQQDVTVVRWHADHDVVVGEDLWMKFRHWLC